jgi:hypothetical protein
MNGSAAHGVAVRDASHERARDVARSVPHVRASRMCSECAHGLPIRGERRAGHRAGTVVGRGSEMLGLLRVCDAACDVGCDTAGDTRPSGGSHTTRVRDTCRVRALGDRGRRAGRCVRIARGIGARGSITRRARLISAREQGYEGAPLAPTGHCRARRQHAQRSPCPSATPETWTITPRREPHPFDRGLTRALERRAHRPALHFARRARQHKGAADCHF